MLVPPIRSHLPALTITLAEDMPTYTFAYQTTMEMTTTYLLAGYGSEDLLRAYWHVHDNPAPAVRTFLERLGIGAPPLDAITRQLPRALRYDRTIIGTSTDVLYADVYAPAQFTALAELVLASRASTIPMSNEELCAVVTAAYNVGPLLVGHR